MYHVTVHCLFDKKIFGRSNKQLLKSEQVLRMVERVGIKQQTKQKVFAFLVLDLHINKFFVTILENSMS